MDLIGRGSCQSLIHALQIAASGDSLRGKRVVLITSPQSYVEGGIAPDLFMANFSVLGYLELLADDSLSDEVKVYLSRRVAELMEEYKALPDAAPVDPAIAALAEHTAEPALLSGIGNAILSPYYVASRWLYDLKDKTSVRKLLIAGEDFSAPAELPAIDWAAEEEAAIPEGKAMSGNNGFWMLDD